MPRVPLSVLDLVSVSSNQNPADAIAASMAASRASALATAASASLTAFSPTAQLAFMVTGPMVDIKLAAMQAGGFGRSFVLRFVPLALLVCTASALLVGWLLLLAARR